MIYSFPIYPHFEIGLILFLGSGSAWICLDTFLYARAIWFVLSYAWILSILIWFVLDIDSQRFISSMVSVNFLLYKFLSVFYSVPWLLICWILSYKVFRVVCLLLRVSLAVLLVSNRFFIISPCCAGFISWTSWVSYVFSSSAMYLIGCGSSASFPASWFIFVLFNLFKMGRDVFTACLVWGTLRRCVESEE